MTNVYKLETNNRLDFCLRNIIESLEIDSLNRRFNRVFHN